MAIRWKTNELDDLRKEIARYNRKISRLQKKGVELGMGSLPERGRIRDVKKMTSRAELNAFKKSMERFLKPGSEALVTTKGGVTIPKYERDQINALNARINQRRRKSWEKANEARARGDLPLMGRIKANEAKPRRSLASVTPKGYAEYKRVALTEGSVKFPELKKQRYINNYNKMIDNLFPVEDAQKIKEAIAKIPRDEFIAKTIEVEEISFAIGSPPATGQDTTSTVMIDKMRRIFPEQFKDITLHSEDLTSEDIIWGGEEAPEWFDD